MDVALITGASAGLGTGFAKALAARGRNLLLVARRADRLQTLAAELSAAHGITADCLAHDLSAPGAADAVVAHAQSAGLTVSTLINNAGFGARGEFVSLNRASQSEMIQLNCVALTELCHAVLPDMIAARRGGILNIASTAAFQPGPNMAVYYATKAYVLSFSEALHEEVKRHGVHVSALCPGPTRTEFAHVADMGGTDLFKMFAGDAAGVVADGLAALDSGRAVKVSGVMNAAMAQSIRLTPRAIARKLAGALQRGRQA